MRGDSGPPLPEDLDLRELPRGVRAELRGLSQSGAEAVGRHLLMAGRLVDSDPALAYAHADAARRRAPRLPVTREATGETAYAAGEWAVALNEFRALRRMSGSADHLAAMADCERGLGRPQAGLKLIKEAFGLPLEASQRVELRLVEAGCRVDLGQDDEALRLLRHEIEESGRRGPAWSRARLRYGYAHLLEAAGDTEQAERWFLAAAALDADNETDAGDRAAALQGLLIEYDETDTVGSEDNAGETGPAAEQGPTT